MPKAINLDVSETVLGLMTRRDLAVLHRDQLKIDLIATTSVIRRLDKEIAKAVILEAHHGERLVINAQRALYAAGKKANLWEAVQDAYLVSNPRDKMAIDAAFPDLVVKAATSAASPKAASVTPNTTDQLASHIHTSAPPVV